MKRFLATFLATVLLVTAIPWTLSAYDVGVGGPPVNGGSAAEGNWGISNYDVKGTKMSIFILDKDDYLKGQCIEQNVSLITQGSVYITGGSHYSDGGSIPYLVGKARGTRLLGDLALNQEEILTILKGMTVPDELKSCGLTPEIMAPRIYNSMNIHWKNDSVSDNKIESTLGLTGNSEHPETITASDKYIMYCLVQLIASMNSSSPAKKILDGEAPDLDYVILFEPLITLNDTRDNFIFVSTVMEYAYYCLGDKLAIDDDPSMKVIRPNVPVGSDGYLWVKSAILGSMNGTDYSPTWSGGKTIASKIFYRGKIGPQANEIATFDDNYHGWGTLFINPYLEEMCGIGSYASVSIGSYSKDITPLTTWLKTKVPIQQDILNYQSATLHGPMPGQLLSSMTSETVFNLDALNDLMPELDDVTKVASGSSIILHDEELLVLAGESYQDVPSSRNTLENTQKLTYGGIIKMEIDGEFFHGKETTIFHEAMKTTQADIKAHPNNYYKDGTALANSLSLKQVYGGNFKVLDQTKVSNKLMSSMVAYAGNNEILKNMTENLSIGTLESAGLASRQNNEVYINMVIEALTGDDLALTYKYFNNESAFGSLASIASTDKYAPDKSGIELPVVKGKAEFQHSAALYNDAIRVNRWVVKSDGTKILLDDTLTATTDMTTNVSFGGPIEIEEDSYSAGFMTVRSPFVPVLSQSELLELIENPEDLISDPQIIANAYLVANPSDITQSNPINVYYFLSDGPEIINVFSVNGSHTFTEVLPALQIFIEELKLAELDKGEHTYVKVEMGTGNISSTEDIEPITPWEDIKTDYVSRVITDGEIDSVLNEGKNIYVRYNAKEVKIIKIFINSGGIFINKDISYERCIDNKIQTPGNRDSCIMKSLTFHDGYLEDTIQSPPTGGLNLSPDSPLTVNPFKDETIVVVYEDTGAPPIIGKIPKDYLSKNFSFAGGTYEFTGIIPPNVVPGGYICTKSDCASVDANGVKTWSIHHHVSCDYCGDRHTGPHRCSVSRSIVAKNIDVKFNRTSANDTIPTSNKYSIFGLGSSLIDYLLHKGSGNYTEWEDEYSSSTGKVSTKPWFSILSHRAGVAVGGNNPTLAGYMNSKNNSWINYSTDHGVSWNINKTPILSGYSAADGVSDISFEIPWGPGSVSVSFTYTVRVKHSSAHCSSHGSEDTDYTGNYDDDGLGRKGLIQAETTYYGGVKDKLDRVSEASVNGSTMIFKQSPETGIKFYPTYSMKAETFRNATPLTVYPLSNKEREYTPQDVFTAKLDESSLQTQVSSTWSKDKADVGTQTMKAGYTWKASDADDSIKMEFVSYIHVPDSRYVSSTGGKDMASAIATHNAFINNYLAMGADGTSLKVYSNVPGNFNPNMPDNLKVPVSNPKTDVAKLVIPELNITYTLPTPTTVSYRLGTASGAKSDYAVGTTSVPAAVEALTKSNARLADTLETGTGYNNWYKEEFEGIEVIVLTSVVTVKNLSSTLVPTYAYLSDNLETSAVNSYGKTYPVSGAGYPTAIPNGKYGVGYALVPKKLNIYNTELTAPKAILYTPQAFNIRGSMFNDKQ